MRINFDVIRALVKRDLKLYFSNPTGYVFITLFIFLSAAAAFWQERFFLNNLANLDQLNGVFPYLLLFFIPAITMGVWADERRQGTDELLLTLPATDLEVVLGKYLATVGIYTGALVLSLSHLVVLFWLGSPDLGLMIANYIGYWFIGAAFIAIGMLASLLATNVTVGFVLGAIFCALFIYVQPLLSVFGEGVERWGAGLAVFDYFGDFSRGVVSLTGLLYFLTLAGLMVFINVVLIGRRHWPREADGFRMWIHVATRLVAIGVAAIAFNALAHRTSMRMDFTAEKLHSLSRETRELIKQIPDDRPVFVQAFLSDDVPKEYIQTRANLFGFLKEIDAVAGGKVQVIIRKTEPFSSEARDAREKFGIVPVVVPGIGAGAPNTEMFMGVAFTCGAEEDVIPFFDRGLPAEYELARSIRVVARTKRKKIGVLNTELKLFGGFDFNSFQSRPNWPVVDELKKQYEVVQISATDSIAEDLDGMIVALPSSLPQEEMDILLRYIEAGNPTLLLIDPLPVVDVSLSPTEESGANVNPFMRNQGPQPKPKGNINGLISALNLQWMNTQVIWDGYNPHPDLASLPPEIVFVGKGNKNPLSFNPNVEASAGLQEMVLLYPGTISPAPGFPYEFTSLLETGPVSGSVDYRQLVQRSFFGVQLVSQRLPHLPTNAQYTIAAYIHGRAAGADTTSAADKRLNLIVISDVDFISSQFFEIRKRGMENLNFDNVTFFLNCIDMLAGDDSFIQLRKRRVQHRTLETVEARTRAYYERRASEEQDAGREAQQALSAAQQRLNERVADVQARTDVDAQTKQIMVRNLQEVTSRQLETEKAGIEAERDMKIQRSREAMESQIRGIQSNIKTLAGVVPPIPVFVLGIMVLLRRRQREREGAAAVRRLRS